MKRAASRALVAAGRTGVLDRYAPFLVDRVIERFCYPGVLRTGAEPRRLRGLRVQALCDPHNKFHRMPYWFGVLFDRALDVFLRRVLRPGDTVIDVGANYGHVTMLAAALVYPRGVVHSFEPHPGLATLVAKHAATQRRTGSVHVWQKALSDTTGTMTLRVNPGWLGGSTVRPQPNRDSRTGTFVQDFLVDVARADDLPLDLPPSGSLVVKVDVEGHEPAVIAGMQRLLTRASAVVVEVTPAWHGGPDGVAALLADLQDRGFDAWDLDSLLSAAPRRAPLAAVQEREQTNVLFVRPGFEMLFARP